MNFSALFRKSYLITFFLGLAAPVMAAPVTFFSASGTGLSATSQNCSSLACSQNPLTYQNNFNSSGGFASSSRSFTFAEGQAVGNSSADLSTGELKSMTSVNATTIPNFSNLGASSTAYMGDSFRTTNINGNSPFNWTSSTQASFSFDLSGISSLGLGALNQSSFFLSIFAPGLLDSVASAISTGAGALPASIFSIEFSLGANNILDAYPFIDSNISTFPSTKTVTFNPNGDFDWLIGLSTGVSRNTSGQALMDFSNTLSASYFGPANSVTYSASGTFPGTTAQQVSPVPLPAGFPLLAAGLGVLGLLRRKQKSAVRAA